MISVGQLSLIVGHGIVLLLFYRRCHCFHWKSSFQYMLAMLRHEPGYQHHQKNILFSRAGIVLVALEEAPGIIHVGIMFLKIKKKIL